MNHLQKTQLGWTLIIAPIPIIIMIFSCWGFLMFKVVGNSPLLLSVLGSGNGEEAVLTALLLFYFFSFLTIFTVIPFGIYLLTSRKNKK